ncbi:hypothetical protein BGX29_000341, partial [Mortierella sp. GBA35]
MRFHCTVAAVLAMASLISAQTTGATTATSTVTTTVTATATATAAPTGTPATCLPAFDCSTAPKGCLNNGVCSVNKVCKCKPGFGGQDCSLLTCGSPLQEISERQTVPTGQSCTSCDEGFGGFNCNVCQTNDGCNSRPSRSGPFGSEPMVCNKKPEVFYNSYMTCGVYTPELDSLFPGNYSLTVDMDVINKTLQAQLWLDSAEQFYCNIDTCTVATTELNGEVQTKWDCPNLKCNCVKPSKLCGGIPTKTPFNLENTINTLPGPFSLTCPHNSKNCAFFIAGLAGFFPKGLQMVDCDMGECVFPTEMDSSLTKLKETMSLGVIICLGVLGALVLFLIVACSIAKRNQIVLSRTPYTINTEAASLEFRN